MMTLFPLATAARLAGLSLEATNEAARKLSLKVVAEDAPITSLSFKAVAILRDIAPALRRGVTPEVAYREALALGQERIGEGGACTVTQLRPTTPNPDEALRYVDQANEFFYKATTIRYERELNLASAEHLLRRAIAVDPTVAIAWSDLATVLWEKAAQRATCAKLYRSALELDPDMVDALYAVGAIELQEGRPAGALPLVLRASKIAPEESRIFDLLALVYTTLGREEEARHAATRANTIGPPRGVAAPG